MDLPDPSAGPAWAADDKPEQAGQSLFDFQV
jgi:hypothetical protein